MKLTQENLVLNFLANGGRFTSGKARSLGIKNPSAVVDNLRLKGHVIYSNRRKTGPNRSFWSLSFHGDIYAAAARNVLRDAVASPTLG